MKTTIDSLEVEKFSRHAADWWDREGPLKTLHDINPARLAFIKKFQSLSQQRILDVGCGGGILSEALVPGQNAVTGLDVEAEAIAVARAHALSSHLSIEYVCSPLESYEAPVFDLITCMEMLEHVPDPDYVIEHCARLLKPGGLLFLSTINRTVRAYLTAIVTAEYVLGILPRQTHDYDKFIKPSELVSMVRLHDFDMLGIAGMQYNPLTRMATLQDSVAVNYLLVCRKS